MRVSVEIVGSEFTLLGKKALWWSAKKTLLFADSHFGKAATFRKAGLMVPGGTTADMVASLDALMGEWMPRRVMILGDLVHSAMRATKDFESELIGWRRRYTDTEMVLVRGNHDVGRGDLFRALDLHVVQEPFLESQIAFCHRLETEVPIGFHQMAGHVHPGWRLHDGIGGKLRLPCFVIGTHRSILPAFGVFTGLAEPPFVEGGKIFVVAEEQVFQVAQVA